MLAFVAGCPCRASGLCFFFSVTRRSPLPPGVAGVNPEKHTGTKKGLERKSPRGQLVDRLFFTTRPPSYTGIRSHLSGGLTPDDSPQGLSQTAGLPGRAQICNRKIDSGRMTRPSRTALSVARPSHSSTGETASLPSHPSRDGTILPVAHAQFCSSVPSTKPGLVVDNPPTHSSACGLRWSLVASGSAPTGATTVECASN